MSPALVLPYAENLGHPYAENLGHPWRATLRFGVGVPVVSPCTGMTSDLVKIIASDNGCAILPEPQNPVRNPRYFAPGDALLAVTRTG